MKIGQLAKATVTKVETVRYYESIGLLRAPARTASNYRDYSAEHLARLSFIRRARDLGFTLEAVRDLLALSDTPQQSCNAVDSLASHHLVAVERRISDLKALQTELSRMIHDCRHGVVAECNIIAMLAPQTTG